MATSGSYDFTVTRDQILEGAVRALGVLAKSESLTADETTDASLALNMMVKAWMGPNSPIAPGLKLWQREQGELTLDVTKYVYELKPSGGDLDIQIPVEILDGTVLLRDSSDNDTVLDKMTWEEYSAIGKKVHTTSPTNYYYERRRDEGYLYFNGKPDDATKTVVFTYIQTLEDFDAAANNPDFPGEWFEALKYNLALRLAPEYGVAVSQEIVFLAKLTLDQAQFFTPDTTMAYFEPGRD